MRAIALFVSSLLTIQSLASPLGSHEFDKDALEIAFRNAKSWIGMHYFNSMAEALVAREPRAIIESDIRYFPYRIVRGDIPLDFQENRLNLFIEKANDNVGPSEAGVITEVWIG